MGRAILAGAVYFALVFAAGFALGTLRVLFLAPALGTTAATALEIPVMLALCWLAVGAVLDRIPVAPATPLRLAMGATAFALLMVAELGVSLFALNRDLAGHFAHYATVPGALGLAGQLAFAAFPLFRAR